MPIILKNIAILLFAIFPLFFFFLWMINFFLGVDLDLKYVLETGLVYYLYNTIPLLVGGVIHQIIIYILNRIWPNISFRVFALIFTPVIPITVFLLWGGPFSSIKIVASPLILSLFVYVFLMRSPNSIK
jgi:hypothetical protein